MTFVAIYLWIVYVAGGVRLLVTGRPVDGLGLVALFFSTLSLMFCWNPILDLLSIVFAGLATIFIALHLIVGKRIVPSRLNAWCCGGVVLAVVVSALNGPSPTFIIQ